METSTSAPALSHNNSKKDVVAVLPRYLIPNVSSTLPAYANEEADLLKRSFHTGNFNYLKDMPEDFGGNKVLAARSMRREASKMVVSAFGGTGGAVNTRNSKLNITETFSTFEWMPSPIELASDHQRKMADESRKKQQEISDHDMRPARVHPVALPHEDGFAPGKRVEYVISPFEILDERRKKEREESMAKRVAGEFKTAAGDKPLGDRPSHLLAGEMLGYLKKWIQEDWPEASVHTYVNEKHMIVVRFGEGSVESRKGLEAYMNIFSRCNSLVDKYRLTKVGGYWDLAPGDGNIYYTFCPPWVRYNRLENFFSRRPEERHWASSSVTAELAKDRAAMLAEIRSVEGILMAAFLEAHEGTPEARVITDLR